MEGQELTIRIDPRYYRICIHRKTLKAIGNPKYIHFGYLAKTKELMILGTWIDDRRSVRVRFNNKGSFFVTSKALIEGIREVSKILLEDTSYLITGKRVEHIPAISFSLNNAVSACEDGGKEV